jgi:GNAT superfamily N-acetyltransferase
VIERAGSADLLSLTEMEQAASSTALSHIYPADLPFPADDVLARWALVLEDPSSVVLLARLDGEPVGYAAVGGEWLRHFGVVPSHWGAGVADALHAAALAEFAAAGVRTSYLWVLVDNHRARRFYHRHGWVETDVRDTEVFEPHPTKLMMRRTTGASDGPDPV